MIDAIVDGAAQRAGLSVPEGWPDAHDDRFLRLRRAQRAAGRDGSSTAGALEVGYTIFEAYRGRGYATEAVAALIAWAGHEHGVLHFFAAVAPDNAPSLAVVARLGFVRSGEQWDDEDGLEHVFERRTG